MLGNPERQPAPKEGFDAMLPRIKALSEKDPSQITESELDGLIGGFGDEAPSEMPSREREHNVYGYLVDLRMVLFPGMRGGVSKDETADSLLAKLKEQM